MLQTSDYQNHLFDILIFPSDDETAFECYKHAVQQLLWEKNDCDFSKVETYLSVSNFEAALNSIQEIASVDKHVVIDNTPLPPNGADSGADLTAMLQVRTDF